MSHVACEVKIGYPCPGNTFHIDFYTFSNNGRFSIITWSVQVFKNLLETCENIAQGVRVVTDNVDLNLFKFSITTMLYVCFQKLWGKSYLGMHVSSGMEFIKSLNTMCLIGVLNFNQLMLKSYSLNCCLHLWYLWKLLGF